MANTGFPAFQANKIPDHFSKFQDKNWIYVKFLSIRNGRLKPRHSNRYTSWQIQGSQHFKQTKFLTIFQNSRIKNWIHVKFQTILDAIAENGSFSVKHGESTVVCVIYTLVCSITQACNGLPSPLIAILSSPYDCGT